MENYPKDLSLYSGYYQLTSSRGGWLYAVKNEVWSEIAVCENPQDLADQPVWLIQAKGNWEFDIVHANTGFFLSIMSNDRDRKPFLWNYGGSADSTGRWRFRKKADDSEYTVIESVYFPGYVLDIPGNEIQYNIMLYPINWPDSVNQAWKFTRVGGMVSESKYLDYRNETTTALNAAKDSNNQIEQLKSNIQIEQNKVAELSKNLQDANAKATDLDIKLTAATAATTAAETAKNTEIESLKTELAAAKAKKETDENTIKDLTKAAEVAKAKAETNENTIKDLTKAAEVAKAKAEIDENTIKDLTKAVQAASAIPNKESQIIEGEVEDELKEEEEEFKGKLAVIDGAGTAFGRAVALQLQQRGAVLALNDQDNSTGLQKTVISLPPEAIIWQSDYKTMIASEAITMITRLINEKYPDGISYIFNCASFQSSSQGLESLPYYESRRLCALIYLSRAAIPYLAANAIFVNASCMSGRWLQDHTPPDPDTQKQAIDYAVEHGIIGFSKSIVQEFEERRPGVRMNVIATEYIDKIEDKQSEEKRGEVANTVADATVYLFSQKSKDLNGCIIDLDEEEEIKEGNGMYW